LTEAYDKYFLDETYLGDNAVKEKIARLKRPNEAAKTKDQANFLARKEALAVISSMLRVTRNPEATDHSEEEIDEAGTEALDKFEALKDDEAYQWIREAILREELRTVRKTEGHEVFWSSALLLAARSWGLGFDDIKLALAFEYDDDIKVWERAYAFLARAELLEQRMLWY